MKFRRLQFTCTCGRSYPKIKSVGFTSEYELVIHWICAACGKVVYTVKSLADCCRECPESESDEAAIVVPARRANNDAEDARFLRSLGIST